MMLLQNSTAPLGIFPIAEFLMSWAHLGLKLLQAANSMMGIGLHEVDKPAAKDIQLSISLGWWADGRQSRNGDS